MAENMSSSDTSHIDTVEAILYREGTRKTHPVVKITTGVPTSKFRIGNPEPTNQRRTLGSDW